METIPANAAASPATSTPVEPPTPETATAVTNATVLSRPSCAPNSTSRIRPKASTLHFSRSSSRAAAR